MFRVSPAKIPKELSIQGYETIPQLPLEDYWIDQYEFTSRQFKAFVDQGGYQKREYWRIEFQKGGEHLSWDQAMTLFRDGAGRPGPKDWIQGEYPKGQDDFPVSGISWYEAAAFGNTSGLVPINPKKACISSSILILELWRYAVFIRLPHRPEILVKPIQRFLDELELPMTRAQSQRASLELGLCPTIEPDDQPFHKPHKLLAEQD
jgi:Sulfatase-modifying factor enzyme 1